MMRVLGGFRRSVGSVGLGVEGAMLVILATV